jgi:hypothetical protein
VFYLDTDYDLRTVTSPFYISSLPNFRQNTAGGHGSAAASIPLSTMEDSRNQLLGMAWTAD